MESSPYQTASLLAARAFERMAKEEHAPTPENYTLWYNYYAGYFPELTRAIKLMEDLKQPFTQAKCEKLYNKFFANNEEVRTIRTSGEMAYEIISATKTLVSTTAHDTELYHNVITRLNESLNEPTPTEDVHALINEVASESQSIIEKQHNLLKTLNDSASQLSNMAATIKAVWQEMQVDNLTSLHNRKSFERALSDSVGAAKTSGAALSLVVMDIDLLDELNKRHGVLVGDHVLKLFSRLLKDTCKGSDFMARYGGDRFAVILPDTKLGHAISLAEKIRNKLAGQELVNKSSKKSFGSITVSGGAVMLREDDEPRQLVDRAEQALSEAKKSGRNKVCSE